MNWWVVGPVGQVGGGWVGRGEGPNDKVRGNGGDPIEKLE